jgi:hypothetical protein
VAVPHFDPTGPVPLLNFLHISRDGEEESMDVRVARYAERGMWKPSGLRCG